MELNFLDVTTYIMNNIGPLISLTGVLILINTIMLLASKSKHDPAPQWAVHIIRNSSIVLFVLVFIFVFIPTHDDVFQVKLQKLKNEVVNRDNLNRGTELLEKAIQKLECKYLDESCVNQVVEKLPLQ